MINKSVLLRKAYIIGLPYQYIPLFIRIDNIVFAFHIAMDIAKFASHSRFSQQLSENLHIFATTWNYRLSVGN